ncbi:Phosphorylated carbohydrates phosphatase TM_1254 [Fibrisoma limi BUZ 3]|uniref:Phosphorylated carbohydrates phosphatase TM_1254 n=1 Tax=Fibrisoma limi BUZ 3 TaxID=1185876 RepID=I2GBA0_9BACT|nr:HAD family phosphatase [Fibrisoma limi]CCH51174.1 Phosphorylated carbohydrates phosphatase TM_1254 [Fibrisoma limi BUZ 3]
MTRKKLPELALIFDMDGTLIDSNPTHKEAYRQFFTRFDINLTDDDFEQHIAGRSNPDILKHFLGDDLSPQKITALKQQKESLFQELFESKIKPIRGLLPFLKQVKDAGLLTALATSAPMMNVRFLFQHVPIEAYFDKIVCDRDVTDGKPDPAIFQVAARKLKADPARCIVFEDSQAGVESARAAGMRVVALTTNGQEKDTRHADLVIDTYSEITVAKLQKLMSEE